MLEQLSFLPRCFHVDTQEQCRLGHFHMINRLIVIAMCVHPLVIIVWLL